MRIFRFLAALAIALIASVSHAQSLTPAQEATIRTAILAEPALASALAVRDDQTIAAYCNADASPVQKAWRNVYPSADLFQTAVLTEYIARSAAERQAFDLLMSVGVVDASRGKIRNAIADIFSGGTNSTSRGLILNDMTRNATWCEQKLGGTNATTDTVSAWRLNYSGTLTPSQISSILNAGN